MIVTSTNDIKGHKITEYLGLVNANIVVGANFISDWFASWTDVLGGYSNSYQSTLDEIYNKAINELKSKAKEHGANALLGVHFDFDEISGKGKSMFMVTAFGTAVKITSIKDAIKNNNRYEIYQKLYNLSLFNEAGIITSEQYNAERDSLLLSFETEIEVEIENLKSENNQKEAIKQAQILSQKLEEEKKKEAETLMNEQEKQEELRKAKEEDVKYALETFKKNAPDIFVKVKDLLDLNIKSPKLILENLSYNEIANANYDEMNINPSDKMAYTIGRFIKEDKIAEACKYYIDIVNDNDIEYAKSYIYSIYDTITLKNQSTFETMALKLVELKCLGKTDEAIKEFIRFSVCNKETATQVIELL